MTRSKLSLNANGSIIVSILIVMIFLTTIILGATTLASANLHRARDRVLLLQAQYAAESGADSAIAMLNSGNTSYAGTTSDVQILSASQYKATFSVSVVAGSDDKERVITATGKVYAPAGASSPTQTRKIRVIAQRTSKETAASIMSRNILAADSGVKNIVGRDIYVNGFINMAKNTTNLVAENITVAGKNTGATNCSIGGTGNLVNPKDFYDPASYTFQDPSQTKTKIDLAYNNCVSPPGNTSDTDFDVSANQTNISQIQSMYIPWGQYMDGTYQSSPTGCTDWTTGGTTRQIPSTGNPKKTHYPDSSSGIAATCGSSGSLALGNNTYVINDNAHIRASLCAASACDPTFNNPSSDVRYIFVEGTINFDGIHTPAGSGPIVFIAYGTDPASKTGSCPYGGAVYLGKDGTTSAPAAYLLSTNGICLDKTKFGEDPALGGIGGKNIYVATNSGSPFDLKMDPSFPVEAIPIDLAWREVYYQRL
jgi:hypothetical protein